LSTIVNKYILTSHINAYNTNYAKQAHNLGTRTN